MRRLERFAFEGIVSVCPYYHRPSQDGMIAHFSRIAAATDRAVAIYNIPYRTAVNLSNDALLELAEVPNIVGVKDCFARGYQQMGFKEYDTGRQGSWMVQLSDTSGTQESQN